MLVNPNEELPDIIRWFGTRKKIHNVHFRNIHGGFLNFRETFIDNGDLDMLKMARVFKESGTTACSSPITCPWSTSRARNAPRWSATRPARLHQGDIAGLKAEA